MPAPKARPRACQGLACTARIVRGPLCPACKRAIADVRKAVTEALRPPPRTAYRPRVYSIDLGDARA